MKKSKKFILAILIIVIALVFMYLAILQIPKSYLSEKYNLEKNEIKSVYFVPPYFRNESNHSSNIFDFEKVIPNGKSSIGITIFMSIILTVNIMMIFN